MRKIRLALVEDNRILRERIVLMMRKQKNLEVLLASGNWQQVLLKAQKFKSVMVVIESGHPNIIPLLESLKSIPEARVIVTGIIALQADIFELVKRGVSGFVLKEATFSHLLRTVRLVARGAKVLPRALTAALFSQIIEDRVFYAGVPMDGRTTAREREIIGLIREGMSNKEISRTLHIATDTVKSHVHNVLEKLALRNRLQLLIHADHRTKPLKANSSNGSRMI